MLGIETIAKLTTSIRGGEEEPVNTGHSPRDDSICFYMVGYNLPAAVNLFH